jgi:hypothetical protein
MWYELYAQHRAMRDPLDLASSLRRRLVVLARQGRCQSTIQGRFTRRDRGKLRELYIQPSGDREPQGEPLLDLPSLREARLTVLALVSRSDEHLHQFTAMIEGITREEQPWVVAVHLEEDHAASEQDRKGSGACGHASFHCHVGRTLEDEPKVRVPLPAIGPVAALDWLLSLVVPGWEPAPWAQMPAPRP